MTSELEQLQQLLDAAESSSWTNVHIRFGDLEINLGTDGVPTPGRQRPLDRDESDAATGELPLEVQAESPHRTLTEEIDGTPAETVTSPMLGTFWAAPSPVAPPFVQVGDHVEAGEKLCIIEVMKLMTEVVAPCSGEVVGVIPQNGSLVQFGDPLIQIALP